LIDAQVQSYAITRSGKIFDLTASGQIKEYNGSSTDWTALTGFNTVASALVALPNDSVYMLAGNDGGPNQVWHYNGFGSSWTAITGTNTRVYST
jgi:hypothetical protein